VNQATRSTIPPDAKLQVTKGYAPQFGQLSRLLNYIASRPDDARIPVADIIQSTGLSRPHAINMSSLAGAMGLLIPRVLRLTDIGLLVTQHDPFFDDLGTLWLCHYVIASNPRHIVWNRIANTILPAAHGPTRITAQEHFADLRGRYTDKTVKRHVTKEIGRTLRAYTVHRFRNLDYLLESADGYYLADTPAPVTALILLASIVVYRDAVQPAATGLEIPLLCNGENSPGRIMHLSEWRLRETLETLRRQKHIEIESRANLDQIRFLGEVFPAAVLAQYYEER